jgi:hypothetical protein
VAIETSGFTIVHSGKKKDVWKGQATIEYFDWLEGVGELGEHVEENIRTEICSSKNRQFTSVNFIDSPGLTDGQMECVAPSPASVRTASDSQGGGVRYPYPVDEVILFFAEHCDLVLVFFDPIGQALCERTMMVVEQLNDRCPDKVSYYCSKADTITDGNDRQKVLIQITQVRQRPPPYAAAGTVHGRAGLSACERASCTRSVRTVQLERCAALGLTVRGRSLALIALFFVAFPPAESLRPDQEPSYV